MNAEERIRFFKKKLAERWPGLNGCDDLEILLDEPEMVFAVVKFGLDKDSMQKFLEMQERISSLESALMDECLDLKQAEEDIRAREKQIYDLEDRFEAKLKEQKDNFRLDNEIRDSKFENLTKDFQAYIYDHRNLFKKLWTMLNSKKVKSDGKQD